MNHLLDDQVAPSNLITNAANYRDSPCPRRPFHEDNAKNGCESADSNARNQLPASHTSNSTANYHGKSCPRRLFHDDNAEDGCESVISVS